MFLQCRVALSARRESARFWLSSSCSRSSHPSLGFRTNTTRRFHISLFMLCFILFGSIYPVHGQPQSGVQTALATDCTLYVSPVGRATNSGTSPSNPLTLQAADQKVVPGNVVCLLPGTYALSSQLNISKGGKATAYITYKSYDSANPALLNWSGSTGIDMFQVNNNAAYIEFRNLTLNGNNRASVGIKCSAGSHHISAIGNTIHNTGAGGIISIRCDYLRLVGNRIHHTGYDTGNSMGITLNNHVWHDQAAGFHSFVVNNIVAGSYDGAGDQTREGNGISMDLGGNTPPVLIANNLVYMNGGRCINSNQSNNHWLINNTCYANILDSKASQAGNYNILGSSNVRLINNVAKSWTKGYTFKQGDSTQIKYYRNAHYSGYGLSGVTATPDQIRQVEPRFSNPFTLDPTADRQYTNAPHPNQVGTRFYLQSDSPLINAGVDPRTISGITSELKAGIDQYVLTDLKGTRRPQGSGWDIGAYEYTP